MELAISNVKVSYLKEKYGTPLYIYDEAFMLKRMDEYKKNFVSTKFETEVLFASKAFQVKEMLRLVNQKGLSLDVVSYAEYYTATKVNFPTNKIYFHGNNKTYDELYNVINNGISQIVCDNYDELLDIEDIAKKLNKQVSILIRINCGVEAHTHKFIVTSHVDSKFGVIYQSDEYNKMLEFINKSSNVILNGFHSHIGSQIFDVRGFYEAFDKFIPILKDFNKPMILNLGGGFGVRYTSDDTPFDLNDMLPKFIKHIEDELTKNNLTLKKLGIEPGRSIVGEAGYTLYTIGNQKKTPNKHYYFIDGGMADNIRVALYQAKYDADVANRIDEPKDNEVCVAGKCCESGDIIIEKIKLQKAVKGDLLITYTTGAYGYSMASNYNKALFPAVVFVNNGTDKLVVKRQTLDELIEREI